MKRLLYRIFLHNLGLKLIALFSAIVLWLHVTTEKVYTIEKPVKVNYVGIPKNLAILNKLPDHVTAEIRGKGKSLILLKFTHLSVSVDLSKLRPGLRTLRIPQEISLPQGRDLTLIDLDPDSLIVSVDKIMTRRVKVKIKTKGEPKDGFALLKTAVLTKNTFLKGPSQLIRDYPTVETEPISITHRDTTFIDTARLIQPIPKTTVIPESVIVKVYIEEASVKTFERIKLVVSGVSPRKVKLNPQYVKLVASGPKSLMKRLSSRSVKARIYIENLKPGEHKITPTIIAPPWVKILEIKPARVKVTLRE